MWGCSHTQTQTHTLAHLQSLPLNDEVALWHAIILRSTRELETQRGLRLRVGEGERERGRARQKGIAAARALYVIGTCEKYQRGQHESWGAA